MDRPVPRNDLATPLAKFCLTVEEHRRTTEGRVRTSLEFLQHFFPYNDGGSSDLVFRYLPREVRGPILSEWRIRGLKAALRDNDEKVESVVYDALVAGDIDADSFEHGLSATTIVQWVPLASWWALWRGGKLSKKALLKAFEAAYGLGLFDAKWFLSTIESRNGKLRGTDVIAEGLTKVDLTEWVRRIQESGDGSPTGLVAAIGWEKIVTQTPNDVLIAAMDAFALKMGLSIASTPSVSEGLGFGDTTTSAAPPAPSAPSVPAASRSVPPMRSRRPEPALLTEDAVFAATEDPRNTEPPAAADDPVEQAFAPFESAPPARASRPPSTPDEEPPNSGNLRDRIDFIRRRIP